MFNIICICLFALGALALVADLIVVNKNKRLKADFEGLKEWCAETGNDPEKFIEFFNNIKNEIKKGNI